MKPTKGAKRMRYDYGPRNRALLGHLVILGYLTDAQKEITHVRVHPIFMDRAQSLIPGNWHYHEIGINATEKTWAEVQLTDEDYGFAPQQGPKMDPNEVGEAGIWRGKIYTFPASKTDAMRDFLRNLFI